MFTPLQSLVIKSQRSTKSYVLKFGPVSEARLKNNIPQGSCDFRSTKRFINVNQSSLSTDFGWKTRNLELCSGTNVGTNQAKFEKNSISRAILL